MFGMERLNRSSMKRATIVWIIISLGALVAAQDSTGRFVIPIKNWELKLVGFDNFYPTYLADPLGIRFEANSQRILYGDFDHFDAVNSDGTYRSKLVIHTGVRISLFKFTPLHNPKLGVEVDLGVNVPTFMRGDNNDLIGVDGIYYFAIAGKPTEWLSLRFSKHHICTHLGDEFNTGTVTSVTDIDPNTTRLPVRDDMILSAAVRPLWFLGDPQWDVLQVYGDFGFFLPGKDFMGTRQNKPDRDAWLNLQGGVELEYYFSNRNFGGVFSAVNVSSYQSNAFAPNISVSWGYIIPQDRNKRRLRIGMNYYNGRAISNQFQYKKEKSISFYVALDV
jgi:hypothetical protein